MRGCAVAVLRLFGGRRLALAAASAIPAATARAPPANCRYVYVPVASTMAVRSPCAAKSATSWRPVAPDMVVADAVAAEYRRLAWAPTAATLVVVGARQARHAAGASLAVPVLAALRPHCRTAAAAAAAAILPVLLAVLIGKAGLSGYHTNYAHAAAPPITSRPMSTALCSIYTVAPVAM